LDQKISVRLPIDWQAVRAEYESGQGTVAAISARHHTTPKTLHNRATAGGWLRRNTRLEIDRASIIGRMFHLLERQMMQLEENMKEIGDKEVTVLGKLASTLERLIDIDNADRGATAGKVERQDMKELRHKLAQRIAQLKRG
jgi:hypothetical protein